METKELLKKVRKIEIKTKRLSNDLFGGEYHSAFKGKGMTFSEVRQYTFGDDIRNIDWNVTARYNEPFVKVFEEERELTLMLLVDISSSDDFGSNHQFKNEIITEIAATLAFSAMQNNDKIGLVLFTDQIELYIPPKKGKSHVLRIIRELIDFKPKNKKTSIDQALHFLSHVLKKKAVAFVISDFITDQNYQKSLKVAAKKHDLTGIRLYDQREQNIPNLGVILAEDNETGETIYINTSSKKVRNHYAQYFANNANIFNDAFTKSGAGVINCRVDESYVKKLLTFFKQRA